MTTTAPVTAVIPSYNCGEMVIEAVESVLAQTTVPSQIIVVDDGSTDGTPEWLRPYRDRIHYVRQPNQGVSSSRNRGIAEARNDVIAFLDADDVWHPRKIELQLETFTSHSELGLLGTKSFEWPSEQLPRVNQRAHESVSRVTWRRLVVRSFFVTSTIMVRRHVLSQVGWFDPALRRAEDRDLYIRIAKAFPVANLDLPLTGYRLRADSLSGQVSTMADGGEKLLHKLRMDTSGPIGWLLWRQAASYLDYNCANTCAEAGYRAWALGYLLKSMAGYPLPFTRGVTATAFERPKRLLVLLWRLLRSSRRMWS
jgi:glycosyltransferase involved in cell wall biosynthesis